MATSKEESTLEKVEKELQAFIDKKAKAESDKQNELNALSDEYAIKKSEVEQKFDTAELTEDIKRHTYFLKLLKGEIAIPDDLNAKKTKAKVSSKTTKTIAKFVIPKTFEEAKSNPEKVFFALSEIGSGTNPEILKKIMSYEEKFTITQVNSAVNALKKDKRIIEDGKVGKSIKYKVA